MFKKLYENTIGSYESLEEGCQFLNFKTNLFTLKEVFNMPDARVKNDPGQEPWYVGWLVFKNLIIDSVAYLMSDNIFFILFKGKLSS